MIFADKDKAENCKLTISIEDCSCKYYSATLLTFVFFKITRNNGKLRSKYCILVTEIFGGVNEMTLMN